jgi:hypothetical protein
LVDDCLHHRADWRGMNIGLVHFSSG